MTSSSDNLATAGSNGRNTVTKVIDGIPKNVRKDYCNFRKYPPRRYFGLSDDKDSLPDFLVGKEVEYIYGQLPQLIQPSSLKSSGRKQNKLCVDQSSWTQRPGDGRLPFADGTNPSILKVANNSRVDDSIKQLLGPNAYYLTTICMTDSQCAWRDTPQEQVEYNLSTLSKPSTVRTVLLVLDEHFQTLYEETIMTDVDVSIRKRLRRVATVEGDGQYPQKILALDDARLFTYQGQVWVSYREGKIFGYDKQVLNRIHFDDVSNARSISTSSSSSAFVPILKTSDTETLCCGRNMALIDNVHTNQLQALTWVDPVTVVDVNFTYTYSGTTKKNKENVAVTKSIPKRKENNLGEHRRRLSSEVGGSISRKKDDLLLVEETTVLFQPGWTKNDTVTSLINANDDPDIGISVLGTDHHHQEGEDHRRRRRLGAKESHFHGTNGFMVHLPHTGEYLGIGHFHRPPGRAQNEYARFGHHYTHAFFTISDRPPYRLTRLSHELVLPSHANPNDAEIIQFWSGLELITDDNDDDTQLLALAYGINDCEGAATYLDLSTVEEILRDVSPGQEVVDLMMPLK